MSKRSRAEGHSAMAIYLAFASILLGDIVYKAVGTADWRAWTAAVVLGPVLAVVTIVAAVAFVVAIAKATGSAE